MVEGSPVEASLGRVVAISPHLDDAVYSAGALLARLPGAVVITVFAGAPPRYEGVSEWDAASGFGPGDDVVALRRVEDRNALRVLDAEPRWLDFADAQYKQPRPSALEVADALLHEIKTLDADTIAFPLGLSHADHCRTHEACAELMRTHFDLAQHWVAWADIPYRVPHAGLLRERLDELAVAGYSLTPFTVAPDERKRAALAEYPSQLKSMGESTENAFRPEQFFLLSR